MLDVAVTPANVIVYVPAFVGTVVLAVYPALLYVYVAPVLLNVTTLPNCSLFTNPLALVLYVFVMSAATPVYVALLLSAVNVTVNAFLLIVNVNVLSVVLLVSAHT